MSDLSSTARLSWQAASVLGLLFSGIFFSQAKIPYFKSLPRDLIFVIAGLLSSLLGIVPSTQIYQASANQSIFAVLGLWVLKEASEQHLFSFLPKMNQKWTFGPKREPSRINFLDHFRDTSRRIPIGRRKWKACAILLFFLAAIVVIFMKAPIGTSFFCAGLCTLLIHPFSLKKTFREGFPLPFFLEIFGAYLFFFAIQNSGLSQWAASFIQGWPLLVLIPLFFSLALILSAIVPGPLAFAVFFSTASALFSQSQSQCLLLGGAIAFAVVILSFRKLIPIGKKAMKPSDRVCS